MEALGKIDCHHHIIPQFQQEHSEAIKIPAGAPIQAWSDEVSLAFLDKLNIDTGIISASPHGIIVAGSRDEVRTSVRKWNEYASALRAAHPKRFGFFAALPDLSEDQDGVLEEIRYALDILKADGISLWTSYGGHYLGAKEFAPVFDALNRQRAVVQVHPIPPRDVPFFTTPFLPQPLVDFPHETTRTATDLVLSGRKRQYPNCKIILSHGGGTLPYLSDRLSALSNNLFSGVLDENSPRGDQIVEDLKSFYIDLALSGSPNILDCLLKWAPHHHILWGSDFPHATAEAEYFDSTLEKYEMDSQLRKMCYRDNALALFPRLRSDSH